MVDKQQNITEAVILKLAALPQPVPVKQACTRSPWKLATFTKRINEMQRYQRLLRWAHVEDAQVDGSAAYLVTVDHELNQLLTNTEDLRSRAEADNFCRGLLAELIRRRKEIHSRKWQVENVSKLALMNLVDWIQGELERFNGENQ